MWKMCLFAYIIVGILHMQILFYYAYYLLNENDPYKTHSCSPLSDAIFDLSVFD